MSTGAVNMVMSRSGVFSHYRDIPATRPWPRFPLFPMPGLHGSHSFRHRRRNGFAVPAGAPHTGPADRGATSRRARPTTNRHGEGNWIFRTLSDSGHSLNPIHHSPGVPPLEAAFPCSPRSEWPIITPSADGQTGGIPITTPESLFFSRRGHPGRTRPATSSNSAGVTAVIRQTSRQSPWFEGPQWRRKVEKTLPIGAGKPEIYKMRTFAAGLFFECSHITLIVGIHIFPIFFLII